MIPHKARLCFILIIFFFTNRIDAFSYSNPFWAADYYPVKIPGVSKFIFSPNLLDARLSFSLDYIDGIRFGLFLNPEADVQLSKLFNFNTRMKIGRQKNEFIVHSINTGFYLYPVFFMKIHTEYQFRNFLQYRTAEHLLAIYQTWIYDRIKWVHLMGKGGLSIRMTDLDIREPVKTLNENFLVSAFFIWQLEALFNPVFFYSIAVALGNIDRYELFSLNYWQLEIKQTFHLPQRFSLFLHAGFGYAGALPFAGIINRGWVETGVRYALPLH